MASSPPKPVVLASSEEIARRFTVAEGDGARAAIENSRSLTAVQRFGASAILAAEAQAKSRDEELSKVTVPAFDSTGAVAAAQSTVPTQPQKTISTKEEPTSETAVASTTGTPQQTTPATAAAVSSNAEVPPRQTSIDQNNRISTRGSASNQSFNINSFRSEIINNDVLPSHSYLVTFSPFRLGFPENAPLTDFVTNKRNTLVMRCENVVLPTPSLLEEENIRRYGYGPVEKVPYGVQFSDVAMTWLVDNKAEIIDFMHQWMNTIVMHDSPNANMKMTDGGRKGLERYSPFDVGYKDGYANPIVRIYVYNRQNKTVTEYELFDVFPMNIQSMNLGWADENQVQKLTVNFAYTNMRVKAPQKTTATQMNSVTEMAVSSNEEINQPSNKGGKAAADKAVSPIGEIIVSSVNASKPYSYETQPDPLNLGTPATLTLITRELTP
jgi:hypothetical protein